jgi:hypothetical protein
MHSFRRAQPCQNERRVVVLLAWPWWLGRRTRMYRIPFFATCSSPIAPSLAASLLLLSPFLPFLPSIPLSFFHHLSLPSVLILGADHPFFFLTSSPPPPSIPHQTTRFFSHFFFSSPATTPLYNANRKISSPKLFDDYGLRKRKPWIRWYVMIIAFFSFFRLLCNMRTRTCLLLSFSLVFLNPHTKNYLNVDA